MLLTTDALKDMLGTIAIMSLLAVAFGAALKRVERLAPAQAALGALFGGAAVLAMFDPLLVAPGVLVDLRNAPVTLAGAFLGLPGAVAAAGLAAAGRAWIGGAGTACGVTGVVGSALIGLAWARLGERRGEWSGTWLGGRLGRWLKGRRGVALLALCSPVVFLNVALLPAEAIGPFVATLPFLAPLQVVGIWVVGGLMERERAIAGEARRLAAAAARDPLTGLLNRRGFEAVAAGALREASRGAPPRPRPGSGLRPDPGVALLVLDLDRFKRVNDLHGHAAGDAVLTALGPRLTEALRPEDVVARFGGEEVVVLLPGVDTPHARSIAERLCEAVRARPFALPGGSRLPVTASVGGAWAEARSVAAGGPGALDALAIRADAALYAAKAAGRDRCRFDTDAPAPALPGGQVVELRAAGAA